MYSPVEKHDLMPSFPDNSKSQAHFRMVTASASVQTDQSNWFTPHVGLFATHLNHKVPLYVFPVQDQHACDIDALNINWSGLTAYAYPSLALLHRVIQKIR